MVLSSNVRGENARLCLADGAITRVDMNFAGTGKESPVPWRGVGDIHVKRIISINRNRIPEICSIPAVDGVKTYRVKLDLRECIIVQGLRGGQIDSHLPGEAWQQVRPLH